MQLNGCFNLLRLNQGQQRTEQVSSATKLIKLARRIDSLLLYSIAESAGGKDVKRHLTHLSAQGDQLNISRPWQILDQATEEPVSNRGSSSSGTLLHRSPVPVVRKLFPMFNLNLSCQSLTQCSLAYPQLT